jgi:hypothetical protein
MIDREGLFSKQHASAEDWQTVNFISEIVREGKGIVPDWNSCYRMELL